MKMQRIIKIMMTGVLMLGGAACFADELLFRDTFDAEKSLDINTNLAIRQVDPAGPAATARWTDNVANDWSTQIFDNALRLYKSKGPAGSVVARLDKDFAPFAKNVRISVNIHNIDPTNGFSMVNFGIAATDRIACGYGFRVDTRYAKKQLCFFDGEVAVAQMDITSLLTAGFSSLVIDFTAGNTVSAMFNGTKYDFGSGRTTYAGSGKAGNYVQLGWYSDGKALTSARFDNLTVTAMP